MTDPPAAPAAARPKRRLPRILIAAGGLLLAIAFAILLISITAESEPQAVQPGDSVEESPSEATGVDALELLETRLQILSSSADLSEEAREELEDVIEDLTLVRTALDEPASTSSSELETPAPALDPTVVISAVTALLGLLSAAIGVVVAVRQSRTTRRSG